MALAQLLIEQNFPAIAIHRSMTQEERLSRYQQFKDFKKVRFPSLHHRLTIITVMFCDLSLISSEIVTEEISTWPSTVASLSRCEPVPLWPTLCFDVFFSAFWWRRTCSVAAWTLSASTSSSTTTCRKTQTRTCIASPAPVVSAPRVSASRSSRTRRTPRCSTTFRSASTSPSPPCPTRSTCPLTVRTSPYCPTDFLKQDFICFTSLIGIPSNETDHLCFLLFFCSRGPLNGGRELGSYRNRLLFSPQLCGRRFPLTIPTHVFKHAPFNHHHPLDEFFANSNSPPPSPPPTHLSHCTVFFSSQNDGKLSDKSCAHSSPIVLRVIHQYNTYRRILDCVLVHFRLLRLKVVH